MLDNFLRKVYINIGPLEVTGRWLLDIHNYFYRLVLEPREFIVWYEQFLFVCQQPDTMAGNICYFNRRISVVMR